jgi:hypothetical protein
MNPLSVARESQIITLGSKPVSAVHYIGQLSLQCTKIRENDQLCGRFCGLVVRVPGYRSRGPGFDSWLNHIF